MPVTEYTKSVSQDFPNEVVDLIKFQQEVEADSGITTAIDSTLGLSTRGDVFSIWFEDVLSGGEETALNALVAAHDGQPLAQFQFHTTSSIVSGAKTVTEDQTWQHLGAAVTTLAAFMSDVSKAWGRVIGQVKVSGTGAELRIIRDSDGAVLSPVCTPADSGGEWAAMQFWANQNQPAGFDRFCLQGRLNGATSMEVRDVAMSLLELLT